MHVTLFIQGLAFHLLTVPSYYSGHLDIIYLSFKHSLVTAQLALCVGSECALFMLIIFCVSPVIVGCSRTSLCYLDRDSEMEIVFFSPGPCNTVTQILYCVSILINITTNDEGAGGEWKTTVKRKDNRKDTKKPQRTSIIKAT